VVWTEGFTSVGVGDRAQGAAGVALVVGLHRHQRPVLLLTRRVPALVIEIHVIHAAPTRPAFSRGRVDGGHGGIVDVERVVGLVAQGVNGADRVASVDGRGGVRDGFQVTEVGDVAQGVGDGEGFADGVALAVGAVGGVVQRRGDVGGEAGRAGRGLWPGCGAVIVCVNPSVGLKSC
jgi:hypothetical protein